MKELDQQLLDAAGRGNLGSVTELLALGADPNCRDQWYNTPMLSAAWMGHTAIMDLLYEKGVSLEQDIDHHLLFNAAFNAQPSTVRWLLQKGEDANYTSPKTGENALHFAISKRSNPERIEVVRILVEAGADVNQQTTPGSETSCFMRDAFLKGETPLHRAAAYGDAMMIRLLLDAGADPSMKDANGDTPISWGSWHLRPSEVLGLLLYGEVPGWHGFPNPNLNGADLK